MRTKFHAALAASLLAMLPLADAGSLRAATIDGHPADFEARIDQAGNGEGSYAPGASVGANTLRIGDSSGFDFNAVLFFQLPDVSPATILGADLSFTQVDSAGSAPAYNADLWGLGFTNADPPMSGAAESEDYFAIGDGPDLAPGEGGASVVRTKLQDDLLTPADWLGTDGSTPHSTSAAGDANLLAYVQGLYADPGFVPGTSYLILRLNPDAAPLAGTTTRYTVVSGDANSVPALTLNVVPEPASWALAGAGLAGLLAVRWKR